MLLFFLACLPYSGRQWSDSSVEADADTDADADSDTDADADADSDSDSDSDGDADADLDGDGYTEAEGDCDDDDDDVHPGARDTCDGADTDCDGDVDEDFDGDTYEPNDDELYDLGDLTEDGDVVWGYIAPEDDLDTFMFYLEDGWWDSFDFYVIVSPPVKVDVGLELYFWTGDEWDLLGSSDSGGAGSTERIYFEGTTGTSDTGYYAVAVWSEDGESCSDAYTFEVQVP